MSAFTGEEHVSGLAKEIREATSSEQYDLAGYTEIRAKDLIKHAFGSPLPLAKTMIRCTLVVGGGKLVRARYDDDLTKWVVQALKEIGFQDDKSAAETFDSQGTYKQQHDTGQNLKYVIVFPHVAAANQSSGEGATATQKKDESAPENIVIACELSLFNEIQASKTPTWRQKKKLLKVIQDGVDRYTTIEAKLMNGTALDPIEQDFYDSNPGNGTEKITALQNEIKALVDHGKLSESEKTELLSQIDKNINETKQHIAEAKAENKAPKAAKLEEKLAGLVARKETITKTAPVVHKLKYYDEILTFRLRLLPLLSLEDKGRSISLTLADLKSLEEKSDLEEKIAQLEQASRGWFETEDDFKLMCDNIAKEAKTRYAKKVASKAPAKPTSYASASSSSWTTMGKPKPSSAPKTAAVKKSGFSAAFDDDSD